MVENAEEDVTDVDADATQDVLVVVVPQVVTATPMATAPTLAGTASPPVQTM